MPGNTNNNTILTATNQIVQAINDLVQELKDVQITINNQTGSGGGCGCCCDDGGSLGESTTTGENGEVYYGEETPAEEDRTGDPPPGFENWAEYDQNKCNVAAAIVSGLAIWFRRFSQIQDVAFVTSSIVVGLAAGTVLAFPPAIIIVIVGVMVLLYVESQALEGLADDIDTNSEELQCGIYNAVTSTTAIDFLRAKLNVFVDNRFPAAVAWAAKKLITLVITVDTVNKAFVDKIGQNLPDADCSGCAGCNVVYNSQNSFTGWTSADESDAGCSTSATIGTTLETTLNVASLPSVSAIRRYTAPLSAVTSGGWVPSAGKVISVDIAPTSDGLPAGLGISVDYQTDPTQSIGGAFGNGGTLQLVLNSDDTVVGVSCAVSRSTSQYAQGSISTAEITQVCFS